MKIKQQQINEIVNNSNNLEWAKRHYLDIELYRKFEVRKHKQTYYIDAQMSDYGGLATIVVEMDKRFNIETVGCSCYFARYSVCGHILASLLLFKKLNISKFPFNLNDLLNNTNPKILSNYLKENEGEVNVDTLEQKLLLEQEKEALEYGEFISEKFNDFNKKIFKSLLVNEKYQLFIEVLGFDDYSGDISARIKIGSDKFYVVKNINKLVDDFSMGNISKYGSKLEVNHNIDNLDEFSKKELSLIKNIFYQIKDNYRGIVREIDLTNYLDDFFELFYENGKEYTNILLKEKRLCFKIEYIKKNDNYSITALEILSDKNIFKSMRNLYSFDNYVLTRYNVENIDAFLQLYGSISNNKTIAFKEDDFYDFIEQLQTIFKESLIIDLPDTPANKINLDIYADVVDDNLVIDFIDSNEKALIKNIMDEDFKGELSSKARLVIDLLKDYNQKNYKKQVPFVFPLNNNATINLVENIIPSLVKNYKVLIGESLKNFNPKKKVCFNVGVRIENNLLEIDINSENIDPSEIAHILNSYKKKKKFYKLKSGEVISLDRDEFAEMNEMLEGLSISDKQLAKGEIQLPLYEAFKLEGEYFNQEDINYQKEQSFEQLIKNFNEYQDIEIPIKDKYLKILKEYQKAGVEWLLSLNKYHFGGILADDMGLGKTIQTIAYLESVYQKGNHSIVICPASLLLNWQDELDKFESNLKYLCVYGSAVERRNQIEQFNEYDLIITTYDYLKKDVSLYENIIFANIILDEAQYIKNHNTKAAKEVKKLKGDTRIALTGTPIENSLAELWSIFDFLMPGYLYNYHYFKKNYETPIIKNDDKEKETVLKKLVEPFILRRRKKEVLKELPDKIEKNIPIKFYSDEEKLYQVKLSEVNKDLKQLLNSGENNKLLILKLLMELRQICCEPRLLYENINTPSSKMDACIEIVESIIDNQQSVLIFSSFTTVLELLEKELNQKRIKYLKLTGENNKIQRKELVDTFQNSDIPVFLISLKAGGTGLNLTKAQAVIHYDPWWNLSAQNQATDRVHRIGQENNVEVFNLIMKNSIEEKIIKLQEKKKNISDMFVENSSGSISKMDASDIINLLKRDE